MPITQSPNVQQQAKDIHDSIVASVKEALKRPKKKHEGVVKTWEGPRSIPTFSVELDDQGNIIEGSVVMEGQQAEQAGLTVWQLLNRGTDVRYMQLSEDWRSKTRPRSLRSGRGGGRKLGVDTANPQDGIAAREWTEAVAEEVQDDVNRDIDKGIQSGFDKAFS